MIRRSIVLSFALAATLLSGGCKKSEPAPEPATTTESSGTTTESGTGTTTESSSGQ